MRLAMKRVPCAHCFAVGVTIVKSFVKLVASCPEFRKDIRDIHSYPAHAEDVVLNHLSIGSVVNELFCSVPGKKAILYHNITPHHYFAAVQPQTAHFLKWGREQMKQLVGKADVTMAVSRYNAQELEQEGYPRCASPTDRARL